MRAIKIVADPVLGEIQALFFLQRRLKVLGAPEQTGLAHGILAKYGMISW